jgi:hypothetical protein
MLQQAQLLYSALICNFRKVLSIRCCPIAARPPRTRESSDSQVRLEGIQVARRWAFYSSLWATPRNWSITRALYRANSRIASAFTILERLIWTATLSPTSVATEQHMFFDMVSAQISDNMAASTPFPHCLPFAASPIASIISQERRHNWRFALHSFRSSERYCIASATCACAMSVSPPRSAMVRATFSRRS